MPLKKLPTFINTLIPNNTNKTIEMMIHPQRRGDRVPGGGVMIGGGDWNGGGGGGPKDEGVVLSITVAT